MFLKTHTRCSSYERASTRKRTRQPVAAVWKDKVKASSFQEYHHHRHHYFDFNFWTKKEKKITHENSWIAVFYRLSRLHIYLFIIIFRCVDGTSMTRYCADRQTHFGWASLSANSCSFYFRFGKSNKMMRQITLVAVARNSMRLVSISQPETKTFEHIVVVAQSCAKLAL